VKYHQVQHQHDDYEEIEDDPENQSRQARPFDELFRASAFTILPCRPHSKNLKLIS
jgi:hypothetical protein